MKGKGFEVWKVALMTAGMLVFIVLIAYVIDPSIKDRFFGGMQEGSAIADRMLGR